MIRVLEEAVIMLAIGGWAITMAMKRRRRSGWVKRGVSVG